MSPLTNIPPKVRSSLYLASALIGLALGAAQVGFQAAEAGFPVWLKVCLSMYAFLAGALGLTAAANTPSYQDVVEGDARPPDERGATDLVTVLVVVVLVVVVLILLGFVR